VIVPTEAQFDFVCLDNKSRLVQVRGNVFNLDASGLLEAFSQVQSEVTHYSYKIMMYPLTLQEYIPNSEYLLDSRGVKFKL